MDVSGWDMIKQTVSGDLGRSHIMTTILSHELYGHVLVPSFTHASMHLIHPLIHQSIHSGCRKMMQNKVLSWLDFTSSSTFTTH